MPSKFLRLAQRVIQEAQRPLSPNEIWEYARSKGYDIELGSTGKSPWNTLGAQLYVDTKDNPDSIFTRIEETRPKRFTLRAIFGDVSPIPVSAPDITNSTRFGYLEKDLHPFIVYYGRGRLKAHLKTIHHQPATKKEFGEWVHPDLVGCHFLFEDWLSEVSEVSTLLGNNAIRLFSFELKRELSFSNLREAFFQAVSNSSWANEGYLVASEIAKDDDFRVELARLSSSFGIGVIEINIDEPDSTDTIFPAREREILDWEMINKLSGMNPDFKEFLIQIKKDLTVKDINLKRYDDILDTDILKKSISQKSVKTIL